MSDPVTSRAKPLLTREELRQYINDAGIPLGASTLEKLCMPSRNEGPPVEAWWGARFTTPNAALNGPRVGSLKLANGAPHKNPGAVLGGAPGFRDFILEGNPRTKCSLR